MGLKRGRIKVLLIVLTVVAIGGLTAFMIMPEVQVWHRMVVGTASTVLVALLTREMLDSLTAWWRGVHAWFVNALYLFDITVKGEVGKAPDVSVVREVLSTPGLNDAKITFHGYGYVQVEMPSVTFMVRYAQINDDDDEDNVNEMESAERYALTVEPVGRVRVRYRELPNNPANRILATAINLAQNIAVSSGGVTANGGVKLEGIVTVNRVAAESQPRSIVVPSFGSNRSEQHGVRVLRDTRAVQLTAEDAKSLNLHLGIDLSMLDPV